MKKRIVVLYGGQSAEREVSVLSAFSVIHAMYYDKYEVQTVFISPEGKWFKGKLLTEKPKSKEVLQRISKEISPCSIRNLGEISFPILHGPMGEDGTIQGFLETIDMPYVGAGVLASAAAMDKIITKQLLQNAEIPQLPFLPVLKNEWKNQPGIIAEKVEALLAYPVFVKPANLGSSVGISCVKTQEKLQEALEIAFRYDSRVVIEQGVQAREIEVAVLGNDTIQTSKAGEIIKSNDFYDYNEKYINNQTSTTIPADIPENIHDQAREIAKKAFITLTGSGLARCDFFLTAENELFFNEINTMPGFTEFSMFPLLWGSMGLTYSNLIEELILLAEKRFIERQKLETKIPTKNQLEHS